MKKTKEEDLYRDAASWETDRLVSAKKSESRAWWVAAIATVLAIAAVFAVAAPVFVNKVVRFNHAALSSFCSLARIALGGFNQTFSILSQFLIAPDQRAGFRVRAAA